MYAAFGWLFIPLLIMAWPTPRIELSAVATTNGDVILTWTTPTPPLGTTLTSLDVRYGTNPPSTLNWTNHQRVPWLTDPGQPGTVTTGIVPGLPYANYYFALKVENSSASWSTMSTLPLVLAGSPIYPPIVLGWHASSDPIVAGYNVYYGGAPGTYTNVVNAGNATMVLVSNLVYGVTYYFAATTYSASGVESPFSKEIHYP